MYKNIAIMGASGAIGGGLVNYLSQAYPAARVHAFSRRLRTFSGPNVVAHLLDYTNENALKSAADLITQDNPLDLIWVATGLLHNEHIKPEKALRDLTSETLSQVFMVNTIIPSLIAKHFVPKFHRDKQCIFAALSARVGSISDNFLGGWYAYRMSKAALNMFIKNLGIELARQRPLTLAVCLHPGSVESPLSKPFHSKTGDLKSPSETAVALSTVLNNLTPQDTGKIFDWTGQEILP